MHNSSSDCERAKELAAVELNFNTRLLGEEWARERTKCKVPCRYGIFFRRDSRILKKLDLST